MVGKNRGGLREKWESERIKRKGEILFGGFCFLRCESVVHKRKRHLYVW